MRTFTDFYLQAGVSLTVLIFGVFLLAGFVKGCIGLGLPTVSVGLLCLAMPAPQAAALLVVPAIITNIWQLAVGGQFVALIRRLAPFLIAICLGNSLGAWLFADVSSHGAVSLLGVALLCYAALGLSTVKLRLPSHQEGWIGALCGAATGLITAVTGVFVLPSVPYLQALGLDRNGLVQAMGIAFMVSTLAMAGGLAYGGSLGPDEAGASILALFPALVGMWAGQHLRRRIGEKAFKRGFFWALALLGVNLVILA
ncbi:sulfite exporter TauE/SafE family protein [Bordetella avium]|uniref:sulfite exporter TauE/SafE family protein n=1 Tax=Bordetella avium TaxID=521 RepID=UPI001602AFAE|nr:sulfite exporter TauE/SafE family protein [Bordetella avium]